MPSQLYTDVYHIESNIYCNDDLLICRCNKLIIIFFKSKNIFSFYLLKQSKESNVSNSIMALINADNPETILTKLIGDQPPNPLTCSVEDCEVKLIAQSLGNYDILITHETKLSLASKNMLQSKACILYLNDFIDVDPVQIFRVLTSTSSPNHFVKNDLVTAMKNVYDDIPKYYVLLLSQASLVKNLQYLPQNEKDVTIHLVHDNCYFKPTFPGLNFTIVYVDADKHIVESLLPTEVSNRPFFHVKKLNTLKNFF
jgi:hypothetical protein